MTDNKYIIKSLAPWMISELIAFSKISNFEIIFLREQLEFYENEIDELKANGINVFVKPKSFSNIIKKISVVINFIFNNIFKFKLNYNSIIAFKTIVWFMRLDLKLFSPHSNIHAQFATQSALLALLIKRYFDNKPNYSFTFHAYDIYFNNKWFNVLVKNSKNVFSISEFNVKYVQDKYISSNKIQLSRLGVFRNDIIETHKRDSDVFTIGLMSWFVEKKGINYLLEAINLLKENGYEKIKLILAGDGPLKNNYLSYVKDNDLTNTVEFIGTIKGKEKEEFYNSLDVFVLPSIKLKNDQDGIPVVLMEAISYHLPIISTNVSGIPEICLDNYNGFLIEERNIQSIYDSIIELHKNKEKRIRFANNSYDLSKKFDIILNSNSKVKRLGW